MGNTCVCPGQQCHLQGTFRFARSGRDLLDYRPGLPIHRFLAIFLMKKGDRRKFEAVGHVEQMEASRCFAASEGRLGCISCHDPHRVPEPTTKAAYYRERCLECHENKGCALPKVQRQAVGHGEDCIACHMPRPAITNVPHTAATDHRILRGMPGSGPERPQDKSAQPGESPLVDYHWALMTEDERRDAARDMGIALGWAARLLRPSPRVAKVAAMQAIPLLEAAMRQRSEDLIARESLGHAFGITGRPQDALNAFEGILAIEPRRESALRSAGRLLARLQRPDLARVALQKTIAVNPWQSEYHLALAGACYRASAHSYAIWTIHMAMIHANR